MKVNQIWTKHLPEDQRENFAQSVKSASFVLKRLQELLLEDLNSIESSEDTDDFEADWAFKQAFRNGQKKALRKITKIIGGA